eukprot:5538-Heterococcus_DN1.PRE.1
MSMTIIAKQYAAVHCSVCSHAGFLAVLQPIHYAPADVYSKQLALNIIHTLSHIYTAWPARRAVRSKQTHGGRIRNARIAETVQPDVSHEVTSCTSAEKDEPAAAEVVAVKDLAEPEASYVYEDDDVEFGFAASDPDEVAKQAQALASAAADSNKLLIQRLIRQGACLSRTAAQANDLSSETKQHISACIVHRMLDLQKQYEHSNEMYCNSLLHPKGSVITAMCTLTEHGCLAATGCEDGSIHVWRYVDNVVPELVFEARCITQYQTELRCSIAAHYGSVTALCSIPKGNKNSAVLASCSTDGTIKLWTIDGREVGYMRCMTKQLIVTTSLNDHTLLAACNSHIELWNLDTDDYCKWQPFCKAADAPDSCKEIPALAFVTTPRGTFIMSSYGVANRRAWALLSRLPAYNRAEPLVQRSCSIQSDQFINDFRQLTCTSNGQYIAAIGAHAS